MPVFDSCKQHITCIHHSDFLFAVRTEDGTLTGRWSTEGCIRISEGEVKSRVICECSTLSSRYAVLREQPEEKEVC